MDPRREKKNIILKMPRSEWVNRKIKRVGAMVKATFKKIKHG